MRGRGWGLDFVMFYEGLRLWEVHLHVFYESGRLPGGRMFNEGMGRGRGERLDLSCFTRV